MIGTMTVEIDILPRTGSRVDAMARVIGPGETDYTFPISISSTIQAIWGIQDDLLEDTLKGLVYDMFSSIVGTASAPPENGYWFDSYNSESTIKATLDRMRNVGQVPYLKNPTSQDQISRIFGGGLLSEIERIDGVFFQKTGMRFVNALDYAFERSEAEHDLGTPPADNPGLLYRICILSVIVDALSVHRAGENPDTPSLRALTNWLEERLGRDEARRITEAFARVKDLRKQYPIHEHFAADASGQRKVRDEVEAASTYFGFQPHHDYAAKWKSITDAFKAAIAELDGIAQSL